MEQKNTNENNILIRIQKSALFNRKLSQKYSDFIFGGDTHFENLLDYAISELDHLLSLDSTGENMMAYQRARIVKVGTDLLHISEILSRIEKNINTNIEEFTLKVNIEERRHREDLDNDRIKFRDGIRQHLPEFASAIDLGISYIVSKEILKRNKIAEELSIQIADLNLKTEKIQEKSEHILADLAMLPTKLQVSNYSELFETESKSFGQRSARWLFATIGCLSLIVILSLAHILAIENGTFDGLSFEELIQINISKIFIATVLFYGLSICNKNYKINKHNEILNKHRKNALSSFQAFVDSPTADATTKNAVLLEATKTIYSAQQTGFMNMDGDDSTIKIIEIINAMSGKKI